MENNFNQASTLSEKDPEHFKKQRNLFLKRILDGDETDLKDEEPDCYVLGYN
ncbi:hypothetical protein [Shewanella psychrotolerans]|uniref:hypothetical protein n=1 Tax=Shewanella psychrotolerans TaxID=2864206 RepID=UPI001C6620A6|nr:hypothetical protein [Shewanella psychrotolerans]QYK01037.1 hypothetical protein K0I62_16905 [Shewanella psychrotolerans]